VDPSHLPSSVSSEKHISSHSVEPLQFTLLSTVNKDNMVTKGDWKAIAKAKQAERLSKIPKEWIIPEELYKGKINVASIPTTCGILTENEIHITSNYDATALLEKLRIGKFSSEEVTVAFCKRAAIAQQLVRSPANLLRNMVWRNAKLNCRPIA
jgi:hypothetical protein